MTVGLAGCSSPSGEGGDAGGEGGTEAGGIAGTEEEEMGGTEAEGQLQGPEGQ